MCPPNIEEIIAMFYKKLLLWRAQRAGPKREKQSWRNDNADGATQPKAQRKDKADQQKCVMISV